jgi:hypothetical protein
MWPGNSRWIPWCVTSMLMLVLVTLAGCVEVKVVDTTPAAATPDTYSSPLPAGANDHDLAVLTADLDPPLNYQQLILRRQAVTLLVAVENTGSSTERDVTVRAELSTPEDPNLQITQGASIASIAPGEIQVVRFARLGEIPYHQIYRLEMKVDPVAGESNLGDNRKAFDIQIRRE